MAGMFVLVDTHGLPLPMAVDILNTKGYMPDWLDFYKQAVLAGWNPTGIVSKLGDAVSDVYGPVFRDAWVCRLYECVAALNLPLPK